MALTGRSWRFIGMGAAVAILPFLAIYAGILIFGGLYVSRQGPPLRKLVIHTDLVYGFRIARPAEWGIKHQSLSGGEDFSIGFVGNPLYGKIPPSLEVRLTRAAPDGDFMALVAQERARLAGGYDGLELQPRSATPAREEELWAGEGVWTAGDGQQYPVYVAVVREGEKVAAIRLVADTVRDREADAFFAEVLRSIELFPERS